MNDIIFCSDAMKLLSQSQQYAVDYVKLKREFYIRFQSPFIFSTRFGAEFFHEVYKYLLNGENLKPEPNCKLGEYDDNFNKWLNKVRKL